MSSGCCGAQRLVKKPTTSPVRCPPGQHVKTSGRCAPCPAGTFQPDTVTAIGEEVCKKCASGYYCATAGLSAPSGVCRPGYYCVYGATSPTDQKCPENYHCPEGAGFVIACPPGTKSKSGSASLQDCQKS